MKRPNALYPQHFTAHETKRLLALEGRRLATFRARAIAIGIDLIILLTALLTLFILYAYIQSEDKDNFTSSLSTKGPFNFHSNLNKTPTSEHDASKEHNLHITEESTKGEEDEEHGVWHYVTEFGIPIAYWGLLTWATNGRTPGRWIAGIRVVSTSHERITLWQSIERALGYSISALEAGFGFIQYFIVPNRRTTHDRIAETIMIVDKDRRLWRKREKSVELEAEIDLPAGMEPPAAVKPTAVEPTAVEPTAVEPTAVEPTAVAPVLEIAPAPEEASLAPNA